MSADNTIIVLVTKRPGVASGLEYRVVHLQNAETLTYPADYPQERPVYNRSDLLQSFGSAKVILDREEAFTEAQRLEDEAGFVEYGICLYDDHPEVLFPTENEQTA